MNIDAIKAGLASSKSSAAGLILAAINYVQGVGATLPSNEEEWLTTAASAAIAAWAVITKDSDKD